MEMCTFDDVSGPNTLAKFGLNLPAGGNCCTHILLVTFFLPSFQSFFMRTCTGQTDRNNNTGLKDAVRRFGGNFAPQFRPLPPQRTCSQTKKVDVIHLNAQQDDETVQEIFFITTVTCTDKFTI